MVAIRRRTVMVLLTVLAVVATGCGGGGGDDSAAEDAGTEPAPAGAGATVPDSPDSGVSSDTIRIGWMGDVTGPTAAAQGFNLAGSQAAVAWINEGGGVLGRELELDVRDDQYSPESMASNYTVLTKDDPVLALVQMGNGVSLMPDVEADGIPLISPPQTIDVQLEIPNVYNDLAHYGDEADVAVAYMGDELGSVEDAVVAVVQLEVPSGDEWNSYIQQTVEDQGGTYAGRLTINASAPDFNGLVVQLEQMIRDDGVNFVAFHGAPEHGLGLITAMVSRGITDVPIVGIHGLAGATIFTEGPPEAEELLAAAHSFLSSQGDCEMCATIREFVKGTEWEEEAVELNFSDGWHEVLIAAEAAKRAAEASGELTWETMNQGLTSGEFDTGGLTCNPDWSQSNHSPCAAVFRWNGEYMAPVQPFEASADVIDGEYRVGGG